MATVFETLEAIVMILFTKCDQPARKTDKRFECERVIGREAGEWRRMEVSCYASGTEI